MAPAQKTLGTQVKQLAKDFVLQKDQLRMTEEKLKGWVETLAELAPAKRPQCASELIALALKFEREGGDPAAPAAAQLYFLAAGLLFEAAEERGAPAKPARR
jgi:hypothetical protein